MSATAFAVPVGDPDTLKRAAGTFATIGSDHQGQLTKFNGQVQNALANWRGPIAEQYAVVSGDAARRFSAVVRALTAVHGALNTYASALETAQAAIGSLNRQVAAKDGVSAQNQEARSLSGQESAAASTLRQAARTCEQALQTAQTTLATQCPDTMTTAQFVQTVKNAENRLNNPEKGADPVTLYSGLEYMLTAYALFASAKGGVAGAKAGNELSESEKLLEALQTQLNPMAKKIIAQLHDPVEQARLLRGWEQVTMDVEKSVKAGQATTAVEGGSFLEGMLKAQNIQIEAEGAHAAASTSSGAAALRPLLDQPELRPALIHNDQPVTRWMLGTDRPDVLLGAIEEGMVAPACPVRAGSPPGPSLPRMTVRRRRFPPTRGSGKTRRGGRGATAPG